MFKDDEDLKSLFKRLGIGIIVLLIFSVIFIIFLMNKFSPHSSKVVESVENKETLYVLIYNNSCKKCDEIQKILKNNKVSYYEINIDKDGHYKEFLKSISVTENEVVIPTLMYIKEGMLDSTIVDIKDEEVLNAFLENTKSN